jgi:hypothetical protein
MSGEQKPKNCAVASAALVFSAPDLYNLAQPDFL